MFWATFWTIFSKNYLVILLRYFLKDRLEYTGKLGCFKENAKFFWRNGTVQVFRFSGS
jgi:hypothetical protein